MSEHLGGLGTAGIAVGAIGAVYSMTQSYIKAHSDTKSSPGNQNRLCTSTPPPPNQALPTVQEGDEAATGSSDTQEGPQTTTAVGRKPKSSHPKSVGLVPSLRTLYSIVQGTRVNRGLIAVVAASILTRSVGELFIYRVTSRIDECVATRKPDSFTRLLTALLLAGIPTVFLQQLSHLAASSLSSQTRHSLIVLLMQRLVLSPHNLCHPEELVDQDRLDALLSDISQASSLGVQIGSDRLKRLTEIALHLGYLVRTIGAVRPLVLMVYLFVTVSVTARQKQAKAAFTKKITERESILKKVFSRLNRHRDDIAVWQGASAELELISRLVSKAESAKQTRDRFEFLHGLGTSLSSRVGGTVLGLALLATCKFDNLYHYFWSARVMAQLSSSVSSLIEDDLHTRWSACEDSSGSNAAPVVKLAAITRRLKASLVDLPQQLPPSDSLPYRIRKSNLCLNDVTALSPDGPVLFQSLSLELSPGGSLLVHGPKGCGKSALLRVVAGTWPVGMGEISRPRHGVYCVPSKPYLVLEASIKEQVAYPDPAESIDAVKLQTAIDVARVGHLFASNGISRSGSGTALMGEADQQRLMLARLLYHQPKFALLDDCWKHLDSGHFATVLSHLKHVMNCGVMVACQTAAVEAMKSPEFGFDFDLELILSNGKQPPRHEIIVNRRG